MASKTCMRNNKKQDRMSGKIIEQKFDKIKNVACYGRFNLHTKRGQQTMSLPFGMIFAIILIAVFFVVAIIAINNFLNLGKCYGVGDFYDSLQEEVNLAWRSQTYDSSINIKLPSGISELCFANLTNPISNPSGTYDEIKNYEVYGANTFLIPPEKACEIPYKNLKHINLAEITKQENPYCISAQNEIRIVKEFGARDVVVK
jgi:hypothetical protein